MKKMEELKNKLKEWLEIIKKEKNVEIVINNFKKIFEDIYTIEHFQEVDDYYECYTMKYILENQIEIEIVTGPWDKFGSKVSHEGTDLNIYSKASNNEEYVEGITIFLESEHLKDFEKNVKKLEKMFEEEIKNEINI